MKPHLLHLYLTVYFLCEARWRARLVNCEFLVNVPNLSIGCSWSSISFEHAGKVPAGIGRRTVNFLRSGLMMVFDYFIFNVTHGTTGFNL